MYCIAIPIESAEKSSHVAIVVTARGGHIGFLEGWWPYSKDQYMGRLFSQFFNATLNDSTDDFKRTSTEMMDVFIKQNHNLYLSPSVTATTSNTN